MTTYTESSSSARAVEEGGAREVWLLGRRRRFLVPGVYQWRSLALLCGLTVLLVGALDAALIALVETGSAHVLQVAPELRSFVVGQLGLPELLSIRREMLDTRFQYLVAVLEAALGRIELDSCAGGVG